MTMTTTTTTSTLVTEAARAAALAKADTRRAAAAWTRAEQDALDAFASAGVTTLTVEGEDGTLTRVTAEGLNEVVRTVDTDLALDLLTDDQMLAVGIISVSLKRLDAALEMGVVSQEVYDRLVGTKPAKPSVRVTFNAKA